jgi:hypothetical protein
VDELPKRIESVMLQVLPPSIALVSTPEGGSHEVDTNKRTRNMGTTNIIHIFNGEMIEFLREIRKATDLPDAEFKAHILRAVEGAEEILSEMKIEL